MTDLPSAVSQVKHCYLQDISHVAELVGLHQRLHLHQDLPHHLDLRLYLEIEVKGQEAILQDLFQFRRLCHAAKQEVGVRHWVIEYPGTSQSPVEYR